MRKLAIFLILLLLGFIGVQDRLSQNNIKKSERLKNRLKTKKTKKSRPYLAKKRRRTYYNRVIAQKKTNKELKKNTKKFFKKKEIDLYSLHQFDLEKLSIEELQEIIKEADRVINEQPESYMNYRIKLILMLALEEKDKNANFDYEIDALLDELARFDLSSDPLLRKEIFILSNSQLKLENKAEEINSLIEEIESINDEIGDEPIDLKSVDQKVEKAILEKNLEDEVENYELLEERLKSSLQSGEFYLNEDIINITLQRSLANGEYEEVVGSGEMLIEEFPDLYIGYLYLIKAYLKTERKDEAVETLMNAGIDRENLLALERRLRDPKFPESKNYWKYLFVKKE